MDLVNFLFPKKCLGCNKEGKYICDNCYCKVTPCNYDYAVWKYEGIIKRLIISLKYKFATDLVDELVDFMADALRKNKKLISKSYCLVPIPLHQRRENWRGFNQAEILGQKLAKKMGWKFIPNLLVRNKYTRPQVGLKGVVRRTNLANVFNVNHNILVSSNYHLVLFDDVYTTGSTIFEARKVLEEAGFKNVKYLTIAR